MIEKKLFFFIENYDLLQYAFIASFLSDLYFCCVNLNHVMQRVAIPIFNKSLSTFLSACSYFEVYTIEEHQIIKIDKVKPTFKVLSDLPEWALTYGITDFIVNKMDRSILTVFTALKIDLFIGVTHKVPMELVNDFIQGTLFSDKQTIQQIINNKFDNE